MKHLKKYENTSIGDDLDFMDSEVRELHDELVEMLRVLIYSPLPTEDKKTFFNKVQDEFDAGAGELEDTYKVWLPDDKVVIGVYEAYGPKHASVKCALDIKSPAPVNRPGIKTVKVSKQIIQNEIKFAKQQLKMWTDIK